jgi:hypothetical protein
MIQKQKTDSPRLVCIVSMIMQMTLRALVEINIMFAFHKKKKVICLLMPPPRESQVV